MRVLVIDDHEVVREGLRMVLASAPEIEVLGTAGSAADALQAARRTLPDLMLVDYRLPDMTGDELCRKIRADFPSTQVVILTTYLSEDVVQRCLSAGAAGFVTKAAGLDELRRVLDEVGRGGRAVPSVPPSIVVQRLHTVATGDDPAPRLTPQQERVLELAANGLTYGQISKRLHISESTVRFHIQSLKQRLGVRTKTELIALAIRSALIAPDSDASVV